MTVKFEQNEVSKVVWPWQEEVEASGTADPKPSLLKVVLQAVLMVSIGLLLLLWRGHHVAPAILFTMATFVVVSGLFFPKAYAVFERIIGYLVKGVGIGLTWLMLVPFFYIFFTPGRIGLALQGKDTLCRKCPTDDPTYWIDRPTDIKPDHYTKQFR